MFHFCLLALLATSNPLPSPKNAPPQQQVAKKQDVFRPFTGKVTANKVRIRLKPDLESHVLRQVNKNDLLLVVAEEGDFYAVEPPKGVKAYVFRSYILDGIVEANRVNVRFEPHIDAPVLGQLQAGDKVDCQICPINHKWFEIAPPKGTRFFISKEFLTSAGGPEYLATMEKRKLEVEELLNSTFLLAESECKKTYEEMSPQQAMDQFQTILNHFADFPEAVAQAKEGLSLLKETYLNKKIAFLESKAELSPTAKEELIAKYKTENEELFAHSPVSVDPKLWNKRNQKREMTDAMHFWDALEESLYLSWTAFHSGKKIEDFYAEQKVNATLLTGTIESYAADVRAKPGDYLLRGPELPIAYLYSTQVNLAQYLGKTVTLLASPRPNNHFAFPAYFVLSVE